MSALDTLTTLTGDITRCRLCADRFAQTQTGHEPRPVPWLSESAQILICGQAPGMRVHSSGVPFDDPSGDRLRQWMGVDRTTFYDRRRIAILPMAFCFPGYRNGADLPPPPICAKTWRGPALAAMPNIKLTLLVGGYALKWHMPQSRPARSVTQMVANWRSFGPQAIPLPHPSWRNSGWLKKNPWFEAEVIPVLRRDIARHL